jgi:hypothetical protein
MGDQSHCQKMREEYEMKGLEKGREKEVKNLQDLLVRLVQTTFPELTDYAQQQARRFRTVEALNLLIPEIVAAPDAATVRRLLESESEGE